MLALAAHIFISLLAIGFVSVTLLFIGAGIHERDFEAGWPSMVTIPVAIFCIALSICFAQTCAQYRDEAHETISLNKIVDDDTYLVYLHDIDIYMVSTASGQREIESKNFTTTVDPTITEPYVTTVRYAYETAVYTEVHVSSSTQVKYTTTWELLA